MKLSYCITTQDYVNFALRSSKKRNQKIRLVMIMSLAVFFTILLSMSSAPIEIWVIFACLLALLVPLEHLFQNVVVKHNAKNSITKIGNNFFDSENSLELSNDGLISNSNLSVSTIKYKNIVKAYCDGRFFYIEIIGGSKFFIPLSTTGLPKFRDELQSKINQAT